MWHIADLAKISAETDSAELRRETLALFNGTLRPRWHPAPPDVPARVGEYESSTDKLPDAYRRRPADSANLHQCCAGGRDIPAADTQHTPGWRTAQECGIGVEWDAVSLGDRDATDPPLARDSGIVLIEVRVDTGGGVADAKVIRSARPFDKPALDAARRWTFRPARVRGTSVVTLAYIAFAFRQPVTVIPRSGSE